MTRQRLPNWRPCEIIGLTFRGARYSLLIGRFQDSSVAEAFVKPRKVAGDHAEDSRDVGIIISTALQSGVPLDTMCTDISHVWRAHDSPTCLMGHVLDPLASKAQNPSASRPASAIMRRECEPCAKDETPPAVRRGSGMSLAGQLSTPSQ